MWWVVVVVVDEVEGRVDAAVSRASLLLSTRTRFMPWVRQNWAVARPMPDAAPVMRAVAPGRKTGWRAGDIMLCVLFLIYMGDSGVVC